MLASSRWICSVAFLIAMTWANQAQAQFGVGTTWVRTDAQGKGMTMTVEACCNGGLRLIYQIPVPNQPAMTLTVNSPMDGTEAPALVGGKPSGETMALKRLDDHRYTAVLKMNGAPFGTSNVGQEIGAVTAFPAIPSPQLPSRITRHDSMSNVTSPSARRP